MTAKAPRRKPMLMPEEKATAMMTMPRRSSTTASVSWNTRAAGGRPLPNRPRTASANAISVATGTAHPSKLPELKTT